MKAEKWRNKWIGSKLFWRVNLFEWNINKPQPETYSGFRLRFFDCLMKCCLLRFPGLCALNLPRPRYGTAKEINLKLSLGVSQAYVANGRNLLVALAGSVLAAKNNASILLIADKAIATATNDILSKYAGFFIFSSTGAVGAVVELFLDKEVSRQHLIN